MISRSRRTPPWGPLVGRSCGPLLVGAVTLMLGCGDDGGVKRTNKRPKPQSGGGSHNLKVGQPSADIIAAKKDAKRPKKVKRKRPKGGIELPTPKEYTERDFVENVQESRDPFRNYLIKTSLKTKEKGPWTPEGGVVYLETHALGELKVTGIVGFRQRFAMIKDPRTGRTTILKTRDRIAKERALIFQINRDHLVLLVPRVKPKKPGAEPYERSTMYVDDSKKIVDISSDALRPDETGIRISGRRGPVRRRSPRTKEP